MKAPKPRKYQWLPSVLQVASRFGLSPTKDRKVIQALRDWWDSGCKVGDEVWCVYRGNVAYGVVTKITRQQCLPRALRLEGVGYQDIDADQVLPTYDWVRAELAFGDYVRHQGRIRKYGKVGTAS